MFALWGGMWYDESEVMNFVVICSDVMLERIPVGLETLAAAIGEDSGTLEDVYEPYLLQNGFLNRTPRGRMASALAYEHLGYQMPEKN